MSKFILLTVCLIILGGLMLHYNAFPESIPHWVCRLPGDISLQKGSVVVYFPLTTALIFSAALSLIRHLLSK